MYTRTLCIGSLLEWEKTRKDLMQFDHPSMGTILMKDLKNTPIITDVWYLMLQ